MICALELGIASSLRLPLCWLIAKGTLDYHMSVVASKVMHHYNNISVVEVAQIAPRISSTFGTPCPTQVIHTLHLLLINNAER